MSNNNSILIYGEFSGFGRSLCSGFRGIGYKCDVFSPDSDGYKNITSDIRIKGRNRFAKLYSLVCLIPSFLRYEKIIIMNQTFFSLSLLGPLILLFFFLFRKDVYLLACGTDSQYVKCGNNGALDRYPLEGTDLQKEDFQNKPYDKFILKCICLIAKKIIPTMYDYWYCWNLSKYKNKLNSVIPLSCDGEVIPVRELSPNDELNILHGITRADVKGSEEILSALSLIGDKYEYVKIHTPSKISQFEYLELMRKSDISIDQCRTHCYGMNAIYAMLQGHIVLSSSTKYFYEAINLQSGPVIDITENYQDIHDKLDFLLKQNTDYLNNLKIKTQEYAFNLHNPENVARKYKVEVFD